MLFLMNLPDPSPKLVAAVHASAAWFEKTAIHGKSYVRKELVDTPDGQALRRGFTKSEQAIQYSGIAINPFMTRWPKFPRSDAGVMDGTTGSRKRPWIAMPNGGRHSADLSATAEAPTSLFPTDQSKAVQSNECPTLCLHTGRKVVQPVVATDPLPGTPLFACAGSSRAGA
jgi:hypothetical protein